MSFKSLMELGDKSIREEIGNYYYISKSRMDELIRNFKQQAENMRKMSEVISEQQEQIKNLQDQII